MTIPAGIVMKDLERLCVPGVLYSEGEIYYLLDEHGTSDILEYYGYPRLNRARARQIGGSTSHILEILWENGYIRKFATGRFYATAGGRAVGVVWEIKPIRSS